MQLQHLLVMSMARARQKQQMEKREVKDTTTIRNTCSFPSQRLQRYTDQRWDREARSTPMIAISPTATGLSSRRVQVVLPRASVVTATIRYRFICGEEKEGEGTINDPPVDRRHICVGVRLASSNLFKRGLIIVLLVF